MYGSMKIIGVYTNHFEAALAKGRLEDAGIEACLLNEYTASYVPWCTPQDKVVRLAVADEEYETAMEVLGPRPGERTQVEACPLCGSENVVFGLRGRRGLGKVFAGILAAVTMSPLGAVGCSYYCRDCRQEF